VRREKKRGAERARVMGRERNDRKKRKRKSLSLASVALSAHSRRG
jgi:hypothetical protein